ncbi:DUF2809 domain-containing protein [Mycetocola sp. 2940]|uniref:ribosomal maturation YjgA family protein n=1 Tax=Mycetocola sp. 2940 TaxID=3156452 RepID=UPI003399EE5A
MPWNPVARPPGSTPSIPDAPPRRPRGTLLALAGIVVVAGILVRSIPGVLGDAGGGILYAGLLFLVVAVLVPAAAAVRIGAISLGICVALEFLQLTGVPTVAAGLVPPIRYVLGTTFVASDLLAYLGGTILAVVTDRVASRSLPAAHGHG